MRKTLLRSAVTLAVFLTVMSGFVAIPATPALGVEGPQVAQQTGINLASVQEEINTLRAEIAKITSQVNVRHEGSEAPLSGYCHSLSETVLKSGVVPGQCLNLK